MDQLTGPKQQALQAYEQLHTLKLEAPGPVRQHLADQRKTSPGYEVLGAVSFPGECGGPDLRVGDVCRMILTWRLDGTFEDLRVKRIQQLRAHAQ